VYLWECGRKGGREREARVHENVCVFACVSVRVMTKCGCYTKYRHQQAASRRLAINCSDRIMYPSVRDV